MVDKRAWAAQQLAVLVGAPNVIRDEDKIMVRPASGKEITDIFQLASRAGLIARAVGYTVGPAAGATGAVDIQISMERMNQISIDRERLTISARPAAGVEKISAVARETGSFFPGLNCRHKHATVGENVAACFNEGAPDFKCAHACLCGLELVLADGRIINVGERYAKDLDNYQLTYILGGYREEQAVLSDIHLKLLPGEQERYWLIAIYQDMVTLNQVLPSLIQKYRPHLTAVAGVKAAAHPDLAGLLRRWAPDIDMVDHASAVCMLAAINCAPGGLEPLGEMLTAGISGGGPVDTSIAGDTYQKLIISTYYGTLQAGIRANPQLSPVSIKERDYNQEIKTRQLAAVYWLKEEGVVNLFYAG